MALNLAGTTGTLSKDGVTAKYIYAEGSWRLRFWIARLCCPISLIEGKLQAYLEQSVAYDASKARYKAEVSP